LDSKISSKNVLNNCKVRTFKLSHHCSDDAYLLDVYFRSIDVMFVDM